MVRVVLACLLTRGGLLLVGEVVRGVLVLRLFRWMGLSFCEVFRLLIFARRLGLVALCVVRLLCVACGRSSVSVDLAAQSGLGPFFFPFICVLPVSLD